MLNLTSFGRQACTDQILFTGHTRESFDNLTKPFFDTVEDLGIPFQKPKNTTYYHSFFPSYWGAWGKTPFPLGTATSLFGNRLLPKSLWSTESNFEAPWNTIVAHVEAGRHFGIYHQAPGKKQNVDNAVSSAWRNAQSFFIASSPVFAVDASAEFIGEANRVLNEDILQPWSNIAPASIGGGSYLNEATVDEPNWKENFYGEQYSRLVSIKKKCDPHGVFYSTTAIGSDEWEIIGPGMGVTMQNGRLCRV
jgi:hypothetical protein